MKINKHVKLYVLGFVAFAGSFSAAYLFMKQRRADQQLSRLVTNLSLQNRFILSEPDGIKQVVPGILLASSLNSPMLSCFEGKGQNCKSFSGKDFEFAAPAFSQAQRFETNGSLCTNEKLCAVERTATFRLECSSDVSCENIKVTARTQTLHGRQISKETTLEFSAARALEVSKVATQNSDPKKIKADEKKVTGMRGLFYRNQPSTLDHSAQPGPQLPPDVIAKMQQAAAANKVKVKK